MVELFRLLLIAVDGRNIRRYDETQPQIEKWKKTAML